jgi:hypothetical protein
MAQAARRSDLPAYFVKLGAMLVEHGGKKWNYDIFGISLRWPKRAV